MVLGVYDSALPFGTLDVVAATLFAIFFLIEAIADYQMMEYQVRSL